jgi:tRNA threonylcarbamoyladenosine biosynthesis protein TsaE
MLIATRGSKIDISSEKKTEEIAKKINREIKPGDILFLYGEMGVGKTTFVRYLINDFQSRFNERLTEVTSPTFNIMNEYTISNLTIKHYDLYRLKLAEELDNLNLFEKNNKAILLIEWPEMIKKKPNSLIELSFEYENDYQNRFITVLN